MAQTGQSKQPPKVHDPIVAVIEPALKAGAACGAAGFIFGGASGIIRGLPPGIGGTAGAIIWLAVSTTFSATRNGMIEAWTVRGHQPTPRDLTKASAIAGAVSGGWYGIFGRNRLRAVPGIIILSLLGAGGQHVYNQWSVPKEKRSGDNFWKRMGDKSWVPFKVLSNEEYSEMLQEKMLKLDVEIAVTEDKIEALKEEMKKEEASKKP